MSAMKWTFLMLAAAFALPIMGCTNEDVSEIEDILQPPVEVRTGKVVSAQPEVALSIRLVIPRVMVEGSAGKAVSIQRMGSPFYVVAFVELPGSDPAYIDPDVMKLADAFSLDEIVVVQITLPGKHCSLKDIDLMSIPAPRQKNLLRFFDPEKLAWVGWHFPPDRSANLVNCMPIFPAVAKQAELSDYSELISAAQGLQKQWDYYQAEMDDGSP